MAAPISSARSCTEDWPTFRGDDQRTGACGDVAGPGTGEVIWRLTTKGLNMPGSPAVVDGTVYFAADQYVYAVDAFNGSVQWTYETGAGISSSPAVVDGTVYIGSGDEHLYALDAHSGELVWRYNGAAVSSPPTIAEGNAYFGSSSGAIVAVDATTGEHVWRTQTRNAVTASPLVANGTVHVGTRGNDGVAYALEAGTGEVVWTREMEDSVLAGPALADGTLYVLTLRGRMEALETGTGIPDWVQELPRGIGGNPPIITSEGILASLATGDVYLLEMTTGDGAWSRRSENATTGSPAVHGSSFYTVDDGGKVEALLVADGSQVWASQVTAISRSSPVLADGVLYVGSDNFEFLALDAGAGLDPVPNQNDKADQVPAPGLEVPLVVVLLAGLAGLLRRAARGLG